MFLVTIIFWFTCFFQKVCGGDENVSSQNDPIVRTKTGLVRGRNLFTQDDEKYQYLGFQGIPYAEPPTGSNRFMAPIPAKKRTGILDAAYEPPICMQPRENDTAKVNMSEDCLYLNVYTPKLNGSYPVMVWIYGGTFLTGSSRKDEYGPDYLIRENVVIVTLNYRLGIFGFLSTKDEVIPGNYGLKDQLLALKWVKNNIQAFGGDRKNVIIFGESAGAVSVSVLMQSELAEGLLHGAILLSGVSLSPFSRIRDPKQMAYSAASALGIFTKNSTKLLSALRKVKAQTLLTTSTVDYLVKSYFGNPIDGLLFAPVLEPENKGAILTRYNYELFGKGNFNRVPVIVGFNSAEGNWIAADAAEVPFFVLKYELDDKLLVPSGMNVNGSQLSEIGKKIRKYYFGNSLTFHVEPMSRYISGDEFIRPTNEFVRLVSKYVPVYYYEFSFVGELKGAYRSLPGVGHGEIDSYLWYTGTKLADEDKPISRKFVKLCTNFAKYRNPTPELETDLDNITWTRSSAVDFPYLDIGSSLKMQNAPHKSEIRFWSSLYETYGNRPYDTY